VKPKKECKATRKTCQSKCDASKCPACEDNNISGFGTPWCVVNAMVNEPTPSTFCATTEGVKKCKKTCDLCD